MTPDLFGNLGLPLPFDAHGSSFFELLRRVAPEAVPRVPADAASPGLGGLREHVVIGTTVLAVAFRDGVVVAGDRRATAGHLISKKDMRKVFPADTYSAVAISGAAGPAMELAKIFATELEHYEKVEGEPLSLEGKANKLSQMIRANLPAAMQGLAVVPLFAGFDTRRNVGRLFEYDVTGGRYEESDFAATGSGSLHAGTVIKIGYRRELDRSDVIDLAINALFQAADEDSATGGPDPIRGIFPIIATITADGFTPVQETEVAERFASLVDRLAATGSTTALGPAPAMRTLGGTTR